MIALPLTPSRASALRREGPCPAPNGEDTYVRPDHNRDPHRERRLVRAQERRSAVASPPPCPDGGRTSDADPSPHLRQRLRRGGGADAVRAGAVSADAETAKNSPAGERVPARRGASEGHPERTDVRGTVPHQPTRQSGGYGIARGGANSRIGDTT